MPLPGMPTSEQDKHLLTSLMFCLGEWCMKVPTKVLLVSNGGTCLLLTVSKVLTQLMVGLPDSADKSSHSGGLFQPDLVHDFDPNILLDNLRETATPPAGRRTSHETGGSPAHHTHTPHCGQAVRLAARMVLMHLLNHLGHFPMGIGAARLSSMVVEHDDVPGLLMDELSAEVFSAPNIQ
ncbi:unnamed protein product, partial [Timema podura]|nr:unnamed protein product [Timema podura]